MKFTMKHQVLAILFILVVMTSCTCEDVRPSLGRTAITLNPADRQNGDRGKDFATPNFVLVSIEDEDGNIIEASRQLALYAFGSFYATEQIELAEGNYRLTELIVFDSNNKAIYATPSAESELAHLVEFPVPITFSVSKTNLTSVSASVLEILEEESAFDFGYSRFGFQLKRVLKSEEIFNYDVDNGTFVRSHKVLYEYKGGKISARRFLEYNEHLLAYEDSATLLNEYEYKNGRLSKVISYTSADMWRVFEYTYPHDAKIHVNSYTNYGGYRDNISIRSERNGIQMSVRYYDYTGSLYWEINCEFDDVGNIVRLDRSPSYPVGTIYFRYDKKLNPLFNRDFIGHPFYFTDSYYSPNNILEESSAGGTSLRSYTYDELNYPIEEIRLSSDPQFNTKRLYDYY